MFETMELVNLIESQSFPLASMLALNDGRLIEAN